MAKAAEPTEAEIMKYLAIDPAQLAKEQAQAFDAKKWVWVPMKGMKGYAAVEIQSAAGDDITVREKGGSDLVVKKEKCEQMNPPKYEKCPDMANLTYLNEATILYNLRARYEAGLMYTYSGLFCVAVNPYRRLPIYNDTCITMFRGKRAIEMPPHLFAIVDGAYQDMLQNQDNQSMLITGESGAGKTENTKKVIMYIAKVAGVQKKDGAAPAEGGKLKGSLDEQIVETNPLMEAYGNAKTVRNNNSSRFGKFIRAHFGGTGKLAGADIETYLLEKNRITFQLSAERNYHIFYQLLYAGSDELLGQICLTTRESKEYLFLSYGVPTVDAIDDHEEYGYTENSYSVLGFTPDERMSNYKICSALLNASNIKLKERKEQAEILDPQDGEKAAFCLGVNAAALHKSMVKPRVKVGTEYVNKGQSMKQVMFALGAICKAMYERMFLWQVRQINKILDTKEKRSYFIGVLDIAGFEIFEYNSFDQLCINLTNEKLQQFFNHTMFVLEQEEYKKEGLVWESIDFGMDLGKTIQLIEQPGGIFPMLEEECIVPKATDQTYLQKMLKAHSGKTGHSSFAKPSPKAKGKDGDFILHHYAGSVGYSVADWLEKNKDPVNEDTAGLFSKASDGLISSLWEDYNPDAGTRRKGSAFQTVSFRHREQLKILLKTLGETSPHFVRCIIPNETKSPGIIDGDLVLHQLRCNGVLEGIRICRKGFPSRMAFSDFRLRYQILAASAIPGGFIDGKEACEKLVGALQLDESEYRVGLTKVFFRAGIVGELEDMRDERLSKIICQFQAYCKGHLMRIEYNKLIEKRVAVAVMQRNIRSHFSLRNWTWWKLYCQVQPMLSLVRSEDEMKAKEDELAAAKAQADEDAKNVAQVRQKMEEAVAEKEKLTIELGVMTDTLMMAEEKLMETSQAKMELEKGLNEALENLEAEEMAKNKLAGEKAKALEKIGKLDEELSGAKVDIEGLEKDKAARDKSIEGLNADKTNLEANLSKLGGEKKGVENELASTNEALGAAEEKGKKLAKEKQKVEGQLADTEGKLNNEKNAKAKLEKEKKKVESSLRDVEGKLGDAEGELANANSTIAAKDKALADASTEADNLTNTNKAAAKKNAELSSKLGETEDELETEKKMKKKVEAARNDLASELESMEEAMGEKDAALAAAQALIKKREAEASSIRSNAQAAEGNAQKALASAKASAAASIAEMQDELDTVQKALSKAGKDKNAALESADELATQLESMKKKAGQAGKAAKSAEEKCRDMAATIEALEQEVQDARNKPSGNIDEATLAALQAGAGKSKETIMEIKNMKSQVESARDQVAAEAKAKIEVQNRLKDALSVLIKNAHEVATQQKTQAKEYQQMLDDELRFVTRLDESKNEVTRKMRTMRKQIEEAEANAEDSQTRYKRIVQELADSEDRAANAEDAAMRAANRAGSSATRTRRYLAHYDDLDDDY